MARRRRLEAPGPDELADLEAGFAAKPVPDRTGLGAPIAQIAGEIARAAAPLDVERRVSIARDTVDAEAWRLALEQGRVIADLPLDQIDLDYMMRDRIVVEPTEIEELKASIQAHGLRLPVEVVVTEDGRYGLVSGWRRVTALRQLHEAAPAIWPTIKAIIRPPYEAAELYTAMVEENELRSQVTPYERGRIAVVAAKLGAFSDTEAAIETIFAAASKAKRSKIRSFALVHENLGDILKFPTELSERNGLRLSHALRSGVAPDLREALYGKSPNTAALEWALIESVLTTAEASEGKPEQNRGGRPKKTHRAKPSSDANAQISGVTIEQERHDDGYSVRLRGAAVNDVMVDQLMGEIRSWLSKRHD